ncbi:hypothetical protein QKU58_gp084 [Pyramimonas orientalis virus]|uniref:Uncharacterized protein n=1 Tax=Pyramimonas orientalis virus 01B TaxID=3134525 RepID=A0A7M3UNI8_9VIRU|nr:hypothetical protein QKU58_gp084 [Pyramimonas orientalis virus]QOI90247.1 hypothetical protein HWQ62_00110 [Pyramimonas orientalis virus]
MTEPTDPKRIEYDMNIHIVNIVNKIIKEQLPHLINVISVKENIDETFLYKCVDSFNEKFPLDNRKD